MWDSVFVSVIRDQKSATLSCSVAVFSAVSAVQSEGIWVYVWLLGSLMKMSPCWSVVVVVFGDDRGGVMMGALGHW